MKDIILKFKTDPVSLIIVVLFFSYLFSIRVEAKGYWSYYNHENPDPGYLCDLWQNNNSWYQERKNNPEWSFNSMQIVDLYANAKRCSITYVDPYGNNSEKSQALAYHCDSTESGIEKVADGYGTVCKQDENGGLCSYSADGMFFTKNNLTYGSYGNDGNCSDASGSIADAPPSIDFDTGLFNTTLNDERIYIAHDRNNDGENDSQISFEPANIYDQGCGYFNNEYVCTSSTNPTQNNDVESSYYIADEDGNVIAGWIDSEGNNQSASFTTGHSINNWGSGETTNSNSNSGSQPGYGLTDSTGEGTVTITSTTVNNPDGTSTTTGTQEIDIDVPSAKEIADAISENFGCKGVGCGSDLTNIADDIPENSASVDQAKTSFIESLNASYDHLLSSIGITPPSQTSCTDITIDIVGRQAPLGICDMSEVWSVIRLLVLATSSITGILIVLGGRSGG